MPAQSNAVVAQLLQQVPASAGLFFQNRPELGGDIESTARAANDLVLVLGRVNGIWGSHFFLFFLALSLDCSWVDHRRPPVTCGSPAERGGTGSERRTSFEVIRPDRRGIGSNRAE